MIELLVVTVVYCAVLIALGHGAMRLVAGPARSIDS